MPNRGDVVVFKTPQDNRTDYIKRVIGLPGDKIKIVNGEIYLNNKVVVRKKMKDFIDNDENSPIKRARKYKEYLKDLNFDTLDIMDNGIADNTELFNVPDGYFFVMGDNRDNSSDSRYFGFVPRENFMGTGELIWMTWECWTCLPSFERAGFIQ